MSKHIWPCDKCGLDLWRLDDTQEMVVPCSDGDLVNHDDACKALTQADQGNDKLRMENKELKRKIRQIEQQVEAALQIFYLIAVTGDTSADSEALVDIVSVMREMKRDLKDG